MPLRNLITASPETLSDMLLAAEDRYQEAEELLMQQRFDGCVYLLGYAAEMWLKAACLRLRSHGLSTRVKAALPALRSYMGLTAPLVPFRDYHDLAFFAESIAHLRRQQGRLLSISLSTELQSRVVNGLYPEWMVDMRYRRCSLTAADAWAALLNAWWVKNNWVSLT
jgi:hypothetical protein